MPSFFKLVVLLSAGVSTLFLSILLLIAFLANKSVPNYDRTVSSPLIEDQIRISRNKYAVPNIEGKTNEDTFFGLGYAHAQDRLWQMLLLRKTAQGKLSEYFGEKTIDVDIFMRTLDIYNNANESTFHLSPKTLAILVLLKSWIK